MLFLSKKSIKVYSHQIAHLVISTIFALISLQSSGKSIKPVIERVDPANWWINMETDTVELLFMAPNVGYAKVELSSEHTKIIKVEAAKNKCYLYITIAIGKQQAAGMLDFVFQFEHFKKPINFLYPLYKRSGYTPQGLHAADNMYLLFPDRFANGDLKNDAFASMNEKTMDRNALKGRHGGDIQGIINHLEYLDQLGTTALWINPLLENNQPYESYHGYAATDSYKTDPRLGSNELLRALVDSLHQRGMKLVWDVVYNHWGNEHYLFKNLPDSNWVHWFKDFTRTTYRTEVLMDPYASNKDKEIFSNAWFDKHMPDLNQQDPHLANYLIQNSIWWIEYLGIDAFRIDTYSYPDQKFMSQLNRAILKEYPSFFIFGETWVQGNTVQAWFPMNSELNKEFSSNMHGVTDFILYFGMTKGLNEAFGWEEGLRRIQMTLGYDVLYEDANRNVTFLDNHDLSRFYSIIGENFDKWKMGTAMIATMRGIPCIYYGHEILMKNFADPDAKVREDFPGGWPNDTINKFDRKNLNEKEALAFDFTQKLFNWRKQNQWIKDAQTTQFVPFDNYYVYFRHDRENLLMCIFNMNDKEIKPDLKRFEECIGNAITGTDIISGTRATIKGEFTVGAKGISIIHFKK